MLIVVTLLLVSNACFATKLGRRNLGLGNWGEDVFELQMRLRDLGYEVVADGRYGSQTKEAVMAFQKAKGLIVDGLVGKETALQLVARFGLVEHRVSKGDTISFLAKHYGVEESDIRLFNGLESSMLTVGQVLRIPAAPRYLVQEGDTVESIAARHQTSPTELIALNQLKEPSTLRPGIWLCVPKTQY